MILDQDPRGVDGLGRALELVLELLREYSEDARAYNVAARVYRRTHQFGLVHGSLLKAQQLTTIREYPSPWLNMALLWEGLGFCSKAKGLYDEVLELHPEDEWARERAASCAEYLRMLFAAGHLSYPPANPGDALTAEVVELLTAAGVSVVGVKCRVKDDLGLMHEVDVLAKIEVLPEYQVPLVVECKDWHRAVPRPEVDKLRAFLDHSRFSLGIVVVSGQLTQGALQAAAGSGMLVSTISELKERVERFVCARMDSSEHWNPAIRDRAARGPSLQMVARAKAAGRRLVEVGASGRFSDAPDLSIHDSAIDVAGVSFSLGAREFGCLERALGPVEAAPLLLLLICMSWWKCWDTIGTRAQLSN